LAFENYLNLIVQLYYKATHTLTDVYSLIDPNQLSATGDGLKPIIQIKRGRKPGRRSNKAKTAKIVKDTENSEQNDSIPPGEGDVLEEEQKQLDDVDVKGQVEVINGALVENIDSLISPLKVDYVFGKIKFYSKRPRGFTVNFYLN